MLNCLQKSMMLRPWGPNAEPTGGAGVAAPASIWSFTTAVTFFLGGAIFSLCAAHAATESPPPAAAMTRAVAGLVRSQLQVVELHAGRPAEQADTDADLALVGEDFLDRSAEIGERALDDLDDLAGEERDLLFRRFLRHRHLDPEQPVHLVLPQRHRLAAR